MMTKPRIGRPPKDPARKMTAELKVLMTQEMYRDLQLASVTDQISMGQIVRCGLQWYLAADHGPPMPAANTSTLAGTWPGTEDDGFENTVDELRHGG
tara:strand:- start:1697 stop:1987 length:291 start_codon:yes stop_codon:yes gene_type:complete